MIGYREEHGQGFSFGCLSHCCERLSFGLQSEMTASSVVGKGMAAGVWLYLHIWVYLEEERNEVNPGALLAFFLVPLYSAGSPF